MHVHLSLLDFLITSGYIILFGLLWRVIAMRFSESRVGQAMAVIY